MSFPRTNCHLGTEANEADLVNQPQDVSYVLTWLLALSERPGGPLRTMTRDGNVADGAALVSGGRPLP